jgi:hypothetical protein
MLLQFKIGTHPLIRYDIDVYPVIGEKVKLPFPSGGIYNALITSIDIKPDLRDCIFRGEWQ